MAFDHVIGMTWRPSRSYRVSSTVVKDSEDRSGHRLSLGPAPQLGHRHSFWREILRKNSGLGAMH